MIDLRKELQSLMETEYGGIGRWVVIRHFDKTTHSEHWNEVTKEAVFIGKGSVVKAQFPVFVVPENGGKILTYPAPLLKNPTTLPVSKFPLFSRFCENP